MPKTIHSNERKIISNICNKLLEKKRRNENIISLENISELTSELTVDSSSYQQIAQSSNAVSVDIDLLQVGSEPVGMRCPYCQEDIMTRASYRYTKHTHIVAVVLGIFFWWLCCCIIPYVTKRWKNVHHSCPRCQKYLGVYTPNTII